MKGENVIVTCRYDSPCGMLVLGSLGDRLCLCDWQVEKHHGHVLRRLERMLDVRLEDGASGVLKEAGRQLDEFFAGERRIFSVPLLFTGTEFQKKVWRDLLSIPYGTTVSYGEMARRIGSPHAVRAVANANGANSISLFAPCHRVVGSDRSLTGYGGGLAAKQYLLELERRVLEE
ncbi:MAG: methylated-DNA--[protein]-cysteine S-methyltransferase [Bacteroidaceae bacterium]